MAEKFRYVYQVKNLDTGLYMTKGCGWSKKGKTWESLGKLKLALNYAGYWSTSDYNKEANYSELPSSAIKIIEIKIVETEDSLLSLRDLVGRQRRFAILSDKYGSAFKDLVVRIEDQNQNDQFQWVLLTQGKWDYTTQKMTGGAAEILEVAKDLKLKQNKDYKKATSTWATNAGVAVAFASKAQAMQVRLAMTHDVQSIDIKEFVETNLDDASPAS